MNTAKKKELFEIVGDAKRGIMSTANLGAMTEATPVILYRDRLLTADVYSLPGQPLYLLLFCPLCAQNGRQHCLKISQEIKKIDFDPKALPVIPGFTSAELAKYLGVAIDDTRGRISIERFECTFETEPSLRRGFGLGVCPWKVVVENNIARDV